MALGYLLSPALQVENINGKPLVGGTITVYRHGTTNPYITYKDFTGDRNPADVVLNDKGMAVILADPNLVYDVYCRDADGVEQWSRLNVTVADPIGAGDGRIYNITSEDGSITSTSSVDVQTGVTTFDLSLTNPPNSTLTVRQEGNRDGTYDTLGTFTATGPNKTITVPKEAYTFQMGNRSCFYNDVLLAYLTDKPVFAYEVHSWYEQGRQKQDLYQYMAMKQYWGDNNFYDGTANIQFVRIDVENNKIVMAKCLPEYPGSITGYATWEKTELSLDGGAGVFYVEYGTTTYAEALAAYQEGKTLVLRKTWETLQHDQADDLYPCIAWYESGSFSFSRINGYMEETYTLTPTATYTERDTVMATRYQVLDTLNAEIAPEWSDLSMEHYTSHDWPIPAGTVVTQIDNTSSDTLQWVYRSKVAIDQNEAATSGPLQDPSKWDKVHICDIMSSLFYANICVTPFADIKAAYDRGDVIMGRSGNDIYPLYSFNLGSSYSDSFTFACLHGNVWYQWVCYQNSTGYEATNGWATPPGMVLFPERANIADGYNNQRTYAVGDLCYNGNLYRCTTAIPVPENWTAAHWTATSINAELARFATVARTGDYNDLSNKPTIPDNVFIATYGTTTFAEIQTAVTAGKLVFLVGHPNNSDMVLPLATITSPRPSIAAFGGIVGHYEYGAKIDSGTWSYSTINLVESSDLATVATTGDYDDLSNKPTIPAAQVNSDWNASSGVAEILNKPDLSIYAQSSSLATVATSGDYDDLSNKPSIPTIGTITV